MHPILFKLGPFSLKTFGLMVAIGMLAGMHFAKKQARKEGIGDKEIETISFWAVVASLVGARFLYTFIENADQYWAHPSGFFAIQEGGISFLGFPFFALPTVWILCRKYRI